MFSFTEEDKKTTRSRESLSRSNAIEYIDKLVAAFEILNDIEKLADKGPINQRYIENTVAQTAKISGKDFSVKMLFTPDSIEPIEVEIILESK